MSTTPLYLPQPAAVKAAHVSGMAAYDKLCAEAEADYDGYWSRLAREFVTWKKPFTKGLDDSNAPFFKWFEDGTLNVSYNCLDKNLEAGLVENKTRSSSRPTTARSTKVTYKRTALPHLPVRQRAEGALGFKKGDRVVIYMPMSDRGRGRDAGLRAHRRDPLGGLRRLLGARACANACRTPARCWSSPPTSRPVAASTCR